MVQKTILMMLLIIGMLNNLTSCKKNIDETYFENYDYVNNSNHNIQIKCYYMLSNQRESIFTIGIGKKLELKQDISLSKVDSLIINADSVKVIFDNNKNILYRKNDTSQYNIINVSNYNVVNESDKERTYKYIFTNNDFDQAN